MVNLMSRLIYPREGTPTRHVKRGFRNSNPGQSSPQPSYFKDYVKGKGKAVPLQVWSGPEGSRKLRFPDYMTTAQDGGKAVSLTHRPPLPPGNAHGTHFCYRLSRLQCHSAIGRIMSMKNSNDTIWNRTSDLPICSAVP
jgi:hypothetical protein